MSSDVLDMYRGHVVPEWWTAEPPPWAARRDWDWYVARAQQPGAVHAAAEAVAAAALNFVPER
jgi:hypothetical protein